MKKCGGSKRLLKSLLSPLDPLAKLILAIGINALAAPLPRQKKKHFGVQARIFCRHRMQRAIDKGKKAGRSWAERTGIWSFYRTSFS